MTSKDQARIVADLVAMNGGRLVGRTRLHKTLFLLQKLTDRKELFEFEYRHYGPYSVDAAVASDLAEEMGLITTEEKPGTYSSPYVIHETKEPAPDQLMGVEPSRMTTWIKTMDDADATVLELAATWIYLRDEETCPANEIQARLKELKPVKATAERLAAARKLLKDLALI